MWAFGVNGLSLFLKFNDVIHLASIEFYKVGLSLFLKFNDVILEAIKSSANCGLSLFLKFNDVILITGVLKHKE